MTAVGPGPAAGPDDGLDGAALELAVGPVAHGGHCIARHEGRVVFVRYALPGERVRAVVTEEHRAYLRADVAEVLEPSPHRIMPPCPYAGPGPGRAHGAPRARLSCGGCDWQHADLAYQRQLKTAVVREQLRRLGGLTASEVDELGVTVRPVPPAPGEPDGQGWRTRIQYTVDSTGRAGLLAHRSHEVVPIDRCLIAHAAVRDTDVLARAWPDHDAVEVIAGVSGDATVLARRPGSAGAVVSGPAAVTERAVGRWWTLGPGAFWQVHPSAPATLAAAVVELLEPRPGDRIWDLYGGAGLFAAALAPHVGATGRITVVEGEPSAVSAARENLRDLATVTVTHSDVAAALRNPDASARSERQRARQSRAPEAWWRSADLVVLDPPRTGAGAGVVAAIVARPPRAVVYVACDPAALARDVRIFRSDRYELVELRAYDLFPHTHHGESVALLTRR